ncbi:zinc ribbon domain-containing protein [Bacillus toyonensis]|uniref:zinc ribbon domain-containing protein n=1 Tax=Bacillus toyonensis TaxID=155322 RepID=UPI00159BA761|nr:zinc ribbon domain-containing protein [Bacillus toyonensis]
MKISPYSTNPKKLIKDSHYNSFQRKKTKRISRNNEKNLLTRSLYCLSQFIEYKANLAGIKLECVNPAYTSQTCSNCSVRNKAKHRTIVYGFKTHREWGR